MNKNCSNSRTSNDVDIRLGPVTKLDKWKRAKSINLTMSSCRQILTSLSFFGSLASLKQSRSRIPDAWSVRLTFLVTVTFYLTKAENRTKISPSQFSYYCFELRYYFCQKCCFLQKMLTSTKIRDLGTKSYIF